MEINSFKGRDECLLCDGISLRKIVDLGLTPLANKLVRDKMTNSYLYPLELFVCQECGHVQLGIVLDTGYVFSDYPYRSNAGITSRNRLEKLAINLLKRFKTESSAQSFKIFEIGSNDGTLLNFFNQLGCTVLGIDPVAEAVVEAKFMGIETINSFFSNKTLITNPEVLDEWNLIIINNVLAHTNYVQDILEAITKLMSDKTVLVIEFSYLVDVYEKNLFDTIYHEHTSYFCIAPLARILNRFGLKIFDVERFDAHGGSARVFVVKNNNGVEVKPSVNNILAHEKQLDLVSGSSWIIFRNNLNSLNLKIARSLSILGQNNKIVGYGVPAKFSTMFYGLGLEQSSFDYFVDDNPHKVGKLVPGLKHEIYPVEYLFETKPKVIFVFCWNYAVDVERFVRRECDFIESIIIPLPKFEIIEISDSQ